MAKRSIVFPNPEQLVGYARKAGLTFDKLCETIEAELAQKPRTRKIVVRGPKQVVTIKLGRDSRKLKKQSFARVEFGVQAPHESETEKGVEREEDAGKASEPSIGDIVDEKNISDMSPAVKKGYNHTPWPLGKRKAKKPRYAIPEQKPNRFDRFLPDDCYERRKLFRDKWAQANKTHDWPSWLVGDYDNHFLAEMLLWVYPNLVTSEEDKHQAAITLEAVNVYLGGHKPSENSPLYGMKEKTIAKRVQRFLKNAEKSWGFQVFCQEFEAEYDRAEAADYMKESYEQAKAQGDLERIYELENLGYVPENESHDDVVKLWRKRLDDEE